MLENLTQRKVNLRQVHTGFYFNHTVQDGSQTTNGTFQPQLPSQYNKSNYALQKRVCYKGKP